MRLKLIVFLLLFNIHFLLGEEINIFVGDAYNYNEFISSLIETKFEIRLDTETQKYYLFKNEIMSSAWIHLKKIDLEKLRKTLEKYNEWEKTAIENQVKIKKEIPNSKLRCKIIWQFGDEWYSGTAIDLYFTFFSQSITHHQLVISSSKIESTSNEYIEYKLDPLYLNKNHIEIFLNNISEKALNEATEKAKKQKEVSDLFQ